MPGILKKIFFILLAIGLVIPFQAWGVAAQGRNYQSLSLEDCLDLAGPWRISIFRAHNLIPFLTARQNALFPMSLVGIRGEAAHNRVLELLEYMEIADRADYLPALLSGGEQQRVAIARALANNPRIILADEPTASLDTNRGKKVMELLKKIAKENQSSVIVVTHDVRMIEGFDYVYHLKDGKLNNQT